MKQISIKWKLFLYFGLFTAIIIAILWLFQVVFLDDFYRIIKEREVKSAAAAISLNIDDPGLENIMTELSYRGELNISMYSSSGEHIITVLGRKEPAAINLLSLFVDAQKQAQSKKGDDYVIVYDTPRYTGSKSESKLETMTLVKMVDDNFIVINSLLVPVFATISTLKVQLIFITAILVFICLILSGFLSRTIGKPIINLNKSAKILATGDYQVGFEGAGYTEIQELSSSLNYATSELSKVDNLRRELIANISHDLRTPLTMITGYSEAMRDLPNENNDENLQIIIDEAKRLTSLVNDVLDISKLESGNLKPVPSRFNLTLLVEATVERYRVITDNIFEFLYDEAYLVDADQTQITQVLNNLINNAVTHGGTNKRIVVRQSLIDDKSKGKRIQLVKIEVVDTGDGIPKDQLPNIWDRYYKVDKNHKRSATGSGIGLSIVKSIVKNHRGICGVESDENGSDFWFAIPRALKK